VFAPTKKYATGFGYILDRDTTSCNKVKVTSLEFKGVIESYNIDELDTAPEGNIIQIWVTRRRNNNFYGDVVSEYPSSAYFGNPGQTEELGSAMLARPNVFGSSQDVLLETRLEMPLQKLSYVGPSQQGPAIAGLSIPWECKIKLDDTVRFRDLENPGSSYPGELMADITYHVHMTASKQYTYGMFEHTHARTRFYELKE